MLTIQTPQTLDGLPVGSVVLDKHNVAWQSQQTSLGLRWKDATDELGRLSGSLLLRNHGPLRLVWPRRFSKNDVREVASAISRRTPYDSDFCKLLAHEGLGRIR